MRNAFMILIVAGLLLPAASWANGNGKGKPEPLPCPDPAVDLVTLIDEQCSCDGVTDEVTSEVVPWRNHGKYVRCVVKYVNQLRKSGCIEKATRRQLKRCAARSTCGKSAAVLCCISKTEVCNDDDPQDVIPGMCGDDVDRECLTDDDCTKTKVRLARSPEVCLERGGEPAGTGSMCTDPEVACAPLPAE